MIREAPAMTVRKNLDDLLNEVQYRKGRIVITKGGKPGLCQRGRGARRPGSEGRDPAFNGTTRRSAASCGSVPAGGG